jgi:hypothetical protein
MTERLVRDIAAGAFRDAIDVLSIIETLEAGNTPSAVAAVNAASTATVAECVYRALWSRLILLVTRAYSTARAGDLHAQYAFDLLKDATLRIEVEKSGDATALASAMAHWAACRGDNRLNIMREFQRQADRTLGSNENPRTNHQ